MATKSLLHSSLTDNVFYRSLLAGNDPYIPVFESDYLLAETVLTSSTSSVVFSGLDAYAAQGYRHLQFRVVTRSNRGDTDTVLAMRFNGDTGATHLGHNLYGNGTSVGSAYFSTASASGIYMPYSSTAATAPSGAFGGMIIDVPNAFSTNKNKTIKALIGQPNPTYNRLSIHSGVWLNTAAVTSVGFYDLFSTLIAGSRFSLYGSK